MDSIEKLWDRIEIWLAANAPERANALEEGATEEEIRAAEGTMGLVFPADIRASFKRHKGYGMGGFLMGYDSYGLAALVDGQQGLKHMYADILASDPRTPKYVSGPIQSVWWHPSWLPFTGDGAGNHCCLDLAPAPGGHVGQIIDFDHEVGPTDIVATSFQAVLSTFATQLENRGYIVQGLNLILPDNIGDDLLVLENHPFTQETLPSIPTLSTRAIVAPDEIGPALNRLSLDVLEYMQQQHIPPFPGQELTVFARYEELADEQIALEVGIEVGEARTDNERILVGNLVGGTVGMLHLFGLPTSIPQAFDEFEERAKKEQKNVVGQPWITFTIDLSASEHIPFIIGRFYFKVHSVLNA